MIISYTRIAEDIAMAKIVGAIGLPHNPNFPALVKREGASFDTAQSYRQAAAELEALRPDVVLIFTTDHLNTFFFENLPVLALGVGDEFSGPNDEVPTVSSLVVPSNAALARHIHAEAVTEGFDLALAQEFEVDHSVIVPLYFVTPSLQTPVIPIFISAHNPPRPPAQRCFELGQAIRRAVESWREPLRVVTIGSGSFSFDVHGHLSPPGRLVGVPDPGWVEQVRGHLERNAFSDLIAEATPTRFGRAGNVSGELLNWIAMLGTLGDHRLAWIHPELQFGNCYAAWR
jgi:gallate dioxygenase